MKAYQVKLNKFHGTNYKEIHKQAKEVYKKIKSKTKRRPYIRSIYFKKDKIFLDYFWKHIWDKDNWRDRNRRLKYYACAIELIKNTRFEPTTKQNPNKSNEILHRFIGITKDKEVFYIQIKEDKRTDQKYLISVFPDK